MVLYLEVLNCKILAIKSQFSWLLRYASRLLPPPAPPEGVDSVDVMHCMLDFHFPIFELRACSVVMPCLFSGPGLIFVLDQLGRTFGRGLAFQFYFVFARIIFCLDTICCTNSESPLDGALLSAHILRNALEVLMPFLAISFYLSRSKILFLSVQPRVNIYHSDSAQNVLYIVNCTRYVSFLSILLIYYPATSSVIRFRHSDFIYASYFSSSKRYFSSCIRQVIYYPEIIQRSNSIPVYVDLVRH